MSVGKQIKKQATSIAKKVVKPVEKEVKNVSKEVKKATKEITKLQDMVKCPVSVTSNFPLCATNYLLDILGYVIYGTVMLFRLPWVIFLNFVILALNWAIMPTIRIIVNFIAEHVLWRPEWRIRGSLAIPYFALWIAHKNDVIRYVNILFPFFNRTNHMKKCYCASSLRWIFQPLQTPTQTWKQWSMQLFHPVLVIVQMYVDMLGVQKKSDPTSQVPLYITSAFLFMFIVTFLVL